MKIGAVPQITEIEIAYRKLKSHIYYESNELFQRNQLAEFETKHSSNIPAKLREIESGIGRWHKDPAYVNSLLAKTKVLILPKKFSPPKIGGELLPKTFLTNVREYSDYPIDAITSLIYIPIELQLVAVLWLMKHGHKLDEMLGDECLGNRLVLNEEKNGVAKGLSLFKPYFTQYQKWRDGAVKEARRRLLDNENAAIVNLDIKNFYHSVRLNFRAVKDDLGIGVEDNLNQVFEEIHKQHTNNLKKLGVIEIDNDSSTSDGLVLPIGLISSPILANWYLKEFDKRILQKLRPSYYSRYVDDILLVIPKPDLAYHGNEISDAIRFKFERYKKEQKAQGEEVSFTESKLNPVESYLLKIFYPIMALVDDQPESLDPDKHRIFKLVGVPNCYIQPSKTLLYFFDADESIAVVDKFKRDLEERSSEFRDFPEGDEIEPSFDESAYHLIYDDSEGKLTTLKDYKENRYGLSVFLAHRIFSALRRIKKVDGEESEKLLKLFRGLNTLKHFRLWEKIFTFFLANEDQKSFVKFYKHTTEQIQKISLSSQCESGKVSSESVADWLSQYLSLAMRMSLALNPNFIKKNSKEWDEIGGWTERKILVFRRSNLIRHHYVTHPLINYLPIYVNGDGNLVAKHLSQDAVVSNGDDPWDEHTKEFSPRRVKFWECCVAAATVKITNAATSLDAGDFQVTYLRKAAKLYDEINSVGDFAGPTSTEEKFYSPSSKLIETHEGQISVNEMFVDAEKEPLTKPRIAFANIKLKDEFFLASLRGKPDLSPQRYNELTDVVNLARTENANLLLLPECSIPHDLISMFADRLQKNQMAMVGGLEHWRVSNFSYNFIITILPFELNGRKDAVVIYRLKNHYSLGEEDRMRREKVLVPKANPYRYDLFNWRGIYFVPYYCVELSDIVHRSIFRSKCDLIIASEWNKDINYFSNIVESLSRDVHAYVAQVNNSKYGDSRLTQPCKTEIKDLLKLKGGLNTTILIGEIDLNALRDFQRLAPRPSAPGDVFKPLPPDFENENVLKRINNERVL